MPPLVVSSTLNKSGRTFAPKAQARRRNAAPPTDSTSARASVERGTGSQAQTPVPSAAPSVSQTPDQAAGAESQPGEETAAEQRIESSDEVTVTASASVATQTSQLPTPEATQSVSTAITRPTYRPAVAVQKPVEKPAPLPAKPTRATSRTSEAESNAQPTTEVAAVPATEAAGEAEAASETQDGDEATTAHGKRKQRKGKRRATEGTATRPKKRRARSRTPEDGENFEIPTSQMTMAELCNDTKTGQKSTRYKKLIDAEAAEKNRRKLKRQRQTLEELEAQAQEAAQAGNPESAMKKLEQKVQAQEARIRNTAPQMRVVNGQLVVDEQSLTLDRHAVSAVEHERMDVVEEDEFTRKVNSGTWKIRKYTHKGWNGDATERFYEGLQTFGTDFTMIGIMLGRDRRECRMKFNKEERLHPKRVNDAILGKRLPINFAAFDQEFGDPAEFDRELERIEQGHAKSLAQAEEEMRRDREAQEEAARHGGEGGDGDGDGQQLNADGEPVEVTLPGLRKKKGKEKKKSSYGKLGKVGEEEIVGRYDDVMAERAAQATAEQLAKEAAEAVVR